MNEPDLMLSLNKHCEELVLKHRIAANDLTEKQLVEALKQAIMAGDFTRFVCAEKDSQAVVYIPFAQCQRLTAQINKLEQLLHDNGITVPLDGDN